MEHYFSSCIFCNSINLGNYYTINNINQAICMVCWKEYKINCVYNE